MVESRVDLKLGRSRIGWLRHDQDDNDKIRVVFLAWCQKSVSKMVDIAMKISPQPMGSVLCPKIRRWKLRFIHYFLPLPLFAKPAFSVAQPPGPHTANEIQIACLSIIAAVPHVILGVGWYITAEEKAIFPCLHTLRSVKNPAATK